MEKLDEVLVKITDEDSEISALDEDKTPMQSLVAMKEISIGSAKFQLLLIMSQYGVPMIVIPGEGNPYAIPISSKRCESYLRELAMERGEYIKKHALSEVIEQLISFAEMRGKRINVWTRVAPCGEGIIIDLGCEAQTRVRVLPGSVELIKSGSDIVFTRPPAMLPLVMPAEVGDLKLLNKYLNVSAFERKLLTGWISYTLAHPKISSTKYPVLFTFGDQGSGKSSLVKLILQLIDPSRLGVGIFPKNERDLSIASQNSHVLAFDNVRGFKADMSDLLCVMSTGGTASSRALYSNDTQHINLVHGAVILNGIHNCILQSDLASRCIPIRTLTIAEKDRRSEVDLARDFEREYSRILRGLLDLTAGVLKHLPDAEVTNPERMIDFVKWLAAMEKFYGAPVGFYQAEFSNILREEGLNSLFENELAAAVFEFATYSDNTNWSGTPSELLNKLVNLRGSSFGSKQWPENAISLSKRLNGLKVSLANQGVAVEITRGKHRNISLKVTDPSIIQEKILPGFKSL